MNKKCIHRYIKNLFINKYKFQLIFTFTYKDKGIFFLIENALKKRAVI